jgi:hypothetical protein
MSENVRRIDHAAMMPTAIDNMVANVSASIGIRDTCRKPMRFILE